MQLPDNSYEIATLFTLTGSATAVWIITSVVGYLLEPKDSRRLKKWLGLALSLVLAFLGATLVQEKSPLIWVVAFVNGFLVYFTAVGANTITAQATKNSGHNGAPVSKVSSSSEKGSFSELWW